MVTLNGLPKFGGSEGEDALQWFDSFVLATDTKNDEAVLRIFPTYLEFGSPAQEWYDDLPDEVIGNWHSIRRQFRQRWVSRPGGPSKQGKKDEEEKFQNHRLTDDDIFTPTHVDVTAMKKVVVDWVENHAQLGAATGLEDTGLIRATMPYLPAFIRAFLRYRSTPPTTFQMLCTKIEETTDEILEFEQLPRQEKSVEWLAELLEIVKKSRADSSIPAPQNEADSDQGKSDTDNTATSAEEDDTNSFPTPENWKKNKVSLDKAGLIDLIQEVIGTLRTYEPFKITIDAARMMNIGLLRYYDFIKEPGQFHDSAVVGEAGTKSKTWQGLFQFHYQTAFSGLGGVNEATETWNSINDNSSKILVAECVYKSTHTHWYSPNSKSLINVAQQSTPYYGGVFQLYDLETSSFLVTSFKTSVYFLLSAYLAERVTGGKNTYQQAAIDSANWILKLAYDEGTHLASTLTWDINRSSSEAISSLSPHVTGLFIEGLCILASVTGEQKWTDCAVNTCYASMVYPDWHDERGIFRYVSTKGTLEADDINTFRGLLIRGLSVAYQRNPTDKRLRYTIKSYINMQLNALCDHARYQDSYSVNWSQPSVMEGPCAHGQMAALELLIAAVIVNHR